MDRLIQCVGTVGCPFFLFCPELDSRYVFASDVIWSVSAQACLMRMFKEIQRDGEWFGVHSLSGPRSVRRFKSSHFSQEKSAG